MTHDRFTRQGRQPEPTVPCDRPPAVVVDASTTITRRARERLSHSALLDRALDRWQTCHRDLELPTALQVFLGSAEGLEFASLFGLGNSGPASFRLELFQWSESTPGGGTRQRSAIRLGAGSAWFVFDERTAWGSRVAPGCSSHGRVHALERTVGR